MNEDKRRENKIGWNDILGEGNTCVNTMSHIISNIILFVGRRERRGQRIEDNKRTFPLFFPIWSSFQLSLLYFSSLKSEKMYFKKIASFSHSIVFFIVLCTDKMMACFHHDVHTAINIIMKEQLDERLMEQRLVRHT